ncbi:MAG: cbb3-type cytochrome c oxidase subunit 3 [Hyphomonadaceae bacterium]
MTYEQATHFAQTWGLVLLATCFGAALIYALWPGNKQKFDLAARSPLENGEDHG